VAVIGASNRRRPSAVASFANLQKMHFRGPVYPVHPKGFPYPGFLPVYPTIFGGARRGGSWLILSSKTPWSPECWRIAPEKGCGSRSSIPRGFKEDWPEGARLEEELVRITRDTGIRVFGPNCQGIINTDPEVSAYCNFTFTRPRPGHISIFSQSGGVGEVINNRLCELGKGCACTHQPGTPVTSNARKC